MKQHITVEQLNELNKKEKEYLRAWWNPKIGDIYTGKVVIKCITNGTQETQEQINIIDQNHYTVKTIINTKNNWLPLLSIGQMMEFLDNHGWYFIHMEQLPKKENRWWIEVTNAQLGDTLTGENVIGNSGPYPKDFELCDALWESVKKSVKICHLDNLSRI